MRKALPFVLLLCLGCPEKDSVRLKRAATAKETKDAGGIGPVPADATLLASGQNVPRDLHVDGLNLYWLNEGRRAEGLPGIFKLSKSGGDPVQLFNGRGVYAIALDDANVYFLVPEALSVFSIPKGGGEPKTIATNQEGLSAIAVDGTHVYWAGAETVNRAPKGGGRVQEVASNISVPIGLAVDGKYAWWYSVTAGKVARVPKKGGHPSPFASEDVTLHAFFADDANLFWSYGSEKKAVVKRMSKSGGKAVELAQNQSVPVEFFADGRDVFWTTGDAVFRVPKEGGAVVKVVDGTDRSISVTADDGHVYWTDRMGRIQSVAR